MILRRAFDIFLAVRRRICRTIVLAIAPPIPAIRSDRPAVVRDVNDKPVTIANIERPRHVMGITGSIRDQRANKRKKNLARIRAGL